MPTNQFLQIGVGEIDHDGKLVSEKVTYKYINLHYIVEVFAHPNSYQTIIRVMLGYEVVDYAVINEGVLELMTRINKERCNTVMPLFSEEGDNK